MTLIRFVQAVAVFAIVTGSTVAGNPALANSRDAVTTEGEGAKTRLFLGERVLTVEQTEIPTSFAIAQQNEYTFTLRNDTSVDMLEFYASPQTATDWEKNVLEGTIQANGDWTTITLSSNRGCLYDFLAVFADGDKLEKFGIDVCALDTHTYYEN